MSSLITDTIREILMEEQQVCLPGIGTLRLSPQAAVASPIEGKVIPPSNRATFNSNLVLDDGRVLRSLKAIPILSETEAKMLLREYLKKVTENLDAGRSVTLEGIGRLFKHFDGEIRFTAGGENFSKDSFGLPDVELKPIVRAERQRRTAADPMLAGTATATATAGTTPPAEPAPPAPLRQTGSHKTRWQQIVYHPDLKQILWYVAVILAAVAILFLGYLLFQTLAANYDEQPLARRQAAPVVIDRPAPRDPLPAVDADRVVPDAPPRLRDERAQPEEVNTTSPNSGAATSSTTGKSTRTDEINGTGQNAAVSDPEPPSAPAGSPYNIAFIATGLYGSSANVTKNKGRINQAGYEAFDRREGRYTRVGVRVQYTNRKDLMETLRAVQRRYDDAFVMEINGEKVRID